MRPAVQNKDAGKSFLLITEIHFLTALPAQSTHAMPAGLWY